MADGVDRDQTDPGLHCLPRPVCRKTLDHCDVYVVTIDVLQMAVTKHGMKYSGYFMCTGII